MDIQELSDGLADAVAGVSPAVVEVLGGRRAPATGLVWGAQHVATASHVIKREEGLHVRLHDGSTREARLVGRDPSTDLALLEVGGDALSPPEWGEVEDVRVGHLAFPVARRGGSLMAAMGIVSDRAGAWHTSHGGRVDAWIDVDTSLRHGFSGGPLLDGAGRVIGVNTSGLTQRGAVLPRSTVARVMERLEAHGTAAPGYLGVGFYPGTLPDDLASDVGQAEALMAVSLEPGGPGEAAGLLVGDALIHIDGQPITGLRQLVGVLGAKGAGADVALTVVRAGNTLDLSATLGARKRGHRHRWGRRRR